MRKFWQKHFLASKPIHMECVSTHIRTKLKKIKMHIVCYRFMRIKKRIMRIMVHHLLCLLLQYIIYWCHATATIHQCVSIEMFSFIFLLDMNIHRFDQNYAYLCEYFVHKRTHKHSLEMRSCVPVICFVWLRCI